MGSYLRSSTLEKNYFGGLEPPTFFLFTPRGQEAHPKIRRITEPLGEFQGAHGYISPNYPPNIINISHSPCLTTFQEKMKFQLNLLTRHCNRFQILECSHNSFSRITFFLIGYFEFCFLPLEELDILHLWYISCVRSLKNKAVIQIRIQKWEN